MRPIEPESVARDFAGLDALRFEGPGEIGSYLARQLLAGIAAARGANRRFLLGCPGGRSLVPVYEALAAEVAVRAVDMSHVVIVMMDDYLATTEAGFTYCPAAAHYSCRRFAAESIVAPINRNLDGPNRIPADHVWLPDPAAPELFDERLRNAGGVNVFLTASGASDGHVAFNPPGSPLSSHSRIVAIAATTRRDNLGTFPAFKSLSDVPGHGVTVGLGTIRDASARVVMVIHGAHKRDAVARLAAAREFSADWPASFVYECRDAQLLLERQCFPAKRRNAL